MPEHRQLFDYWTSLLDGQLPCRSNFKPAQVPRLLPGLFLVDVARPLAKSRIRLAGTKLREIYDREITGHHILDLDHSDHHGYWLDAYRVAVEELRPSSGIVTCVTRSARVMHQHWLKLPLRNRADSIDIVLCLDVFVETAEIAASLKFARSQNMA